VAVAVSEWQWSRGSGRVAVDAGALESAGDGGQFGANFIAIGALLMEIASIVWRVV
jgi:hypothetical protein